MVIRQGDVYWIDLGKPIGSGSGRLHPHVVIQNNVANQSRIGTVIVCMLTSNLDRAIAPGNVLLRRGEAGLPKRSVVNVSQVYTIDKGQLTERIGSLSPARIREILDGMLLLVEPREVDPVPS